MTYISSTPRRGSYFREPRGDGMPPATKLASGRKFEKELQNFTRLLARIVPTRDFPEVRDKAIRFRQDIEPIMYAFSQFEPAALRPVHLKEPGAEHVRVLDAFHKAARMAFEHFEGKFATHKDEIAHLAPGDKPNSQDRHHFSRMTERVKQMKRVHRAMNDAELDEGEQSLFGYRIARREAELSQAREIFKGGKEPEAEVSGRPSRPFKLPSTMELARLASERRAG